MLFLENVNKQGKSTALLLTSQALLKDCHHCKWQKTALCIDKMHLFFVFGALVCLSFFQVQDGILSSERIRENRRT